MLQLIARCKRGHLYPKGGKRRQCTVCHLDAVKQWRKANPEKVKAYKKKDRNQKDQQLWSRYRLRKSEFMVLLEAQDRGCAICLTEFTDDVPPFVDHNHDTKRVRGLLCKKCNSGLGYLGDNPERLKNALAYLSR